MTIRRVPQDENNFNNFYRHFSNVLSSIAETVDIPAAVIARAANDAAVYDFFILRNNVIRALKKAESKIKKRVFKGKLEKDSLNLTEIEIPKLPDGLIVNVGIEDFANKLVQRIVNHQNFNPIIGQRLGIEIIRPEKIADDEKKPVLRQLNALVGGKVSLKCSKQGMKSFRVFGQRGDSNEFEFVGDSTEILWIDVRPNLVANKPEQRCYKAVFLVNNKPVGEYSAIDSVITQP